MTTERKFCRFNRSLSFSSGDPDLAQVSTREIPESGMCLSSFLVISEKESDEANTKKKVLMGKLNPDAPWDHLGALDKKRAERNSRGWMLPSCHLMLFESPREAAIRIAREQLGLSSLELGDPIVVSEVYPSTLFPELKNHWDLEFIFKAVLSSKEIPTETMKQVWKEIRFLDTSTLSSMKKNNEIARSHEDILASAGLNIG
jgi:ADP-ribose pyrophosphatase YjhB (NUDIX family)